MPRFDQNRFRFDDGISVFDRDFMNSGATLTFEVSPKLVLIRRIFANLGLKFSTNADISYIRFLSSDTSLIFTSSFSGEAASFIKSALQTQFSIEANPEYFGKLLSVSRIEFQANGSVIGKTDSVAETSISFSVLPTINGTLASGSDLSFAFDIWGELDGPLSGTSQMSIEFLVEPIPTGLAEFHSNIPLTFLPRTTINGRARSSGDLVFDFDHSFDLRKSPWQGLSEIGNAVFSQEGISSNYGKLPYGEEQGL